ncbi:MAG: IclR family transcriptional regulator [Sphingomonas sp. SCN 67-18]|uniref:IclR family transcriptional regulator domain-containing protein n=1 Tax=uncultured Sphingomonas sp. TaxID=158754 RepID=UPI00086E0217|nr:IclR family transcriptional regulator C-terminal domain-containing protein [Sphingomonas sp. SCN 67-18]ODU22916.1 MAG: IclR family transcriptional regulator [Sphingomonas sp. SCN 67-18]
MTQTPKVRQDPEYLSTLERGLSVLRAFNQSRPEMQLSEVAVATGLNPAVARRCLNTLVQLGYVAQHGRRFLLRPEVLVFGSAFLASMNVEGVAGPQLQALRDETGDSSSMAVLSGENILYIAHVSTNRRIRIGASVGTRFPAYATSLGKVLLAYQGDAAIDAYLDQVELSRFTEHTITSKAELKKCLRAARTDGYASAQDELDYGVVSVAVPVFDKDRQIAAAINCSTSTTRISREELVSTRLPLLQRAAVEIEGALQRWPFLSHALRP